MTNARIDFFESKISKHQDENGFVTLEARPTRAGVLKYNFGGKEIRELRHPDEVFKKESMETLSLKPFSLQHKGGLLNSESVSGFMKGMTGELVRQDGDFLACKIAIFDSKAIKDVEDGKALMLSAGYTCETVDEQGEYKGERYDRKQVNIMYNHVSGVEKGRAGEACQLRLDGDQVALISGIETRKEEQMSKLKLEKIELEGLRLDSVQVEESDGVKTLLDQRDILVNKIKELQADAVKNESSFTGRLDALEVSLKESKESAEKMVSAERLDALVSQRATIISISEAAGYTLPTSGSFEEINTTAKKELLKKADFKSDRLDSDSAYLDAAWDQYSSNEENLKATLRSKRNLDGSGKAAGYNTDFSTMKV
jgi:hypothetical protein